MKIYVSFFKEVNGEQFPQLIGEINQVTQEHLSVLPSVGEKIEFLEYIDTKINSEWFEKSLRKYPYYVKEILKNFSSDENKKMNQLYISYILSEREL